MSVRQTMMGRYKTCRRPFLTATVLTVVWVLPGNVPDQPTSITMLPSKQRTTIVPQQGTYAIDIHGLY